MPLFGKAAAVDDAYGHPPTRPAYNHLPNVNWVRFVDKVSSRGARQQRTVLVSNESLFVCSKGNFTIHRVVTSSSIAGVYRQHRGTAQGVGTFEGGVLISMSDEHDLVLLAPREKKAGCATPDDMLGLLQSLTVLKRARDREKLPVVTLPDDANLLHRAFLRKPRSFRVPGGKLDCLLDNEEALPDPLPLLPEEEEERRKEEAERLEREKAEKEAADQPPPGAKMQRRRRGRHRAQSTVQTPSATINMDAQSGSSGSSQDGAGSPAAAPTGDDDEGRKSPAQWVPDADAPRCMVCGSNFTTFRRRRHHCRECGRVVCDACSPYRLAVPGYETEQRVCADCYHRDPDETATSQRHSSPRATKRLSSIPGPEAEKGPEPEPDSDALRSSMLAQTTRPRAPSDDRSRLTGKAGSDVDTPPQIPLGPTSSPVAPTPPPPAQPPPPPPHPQSTPVPPAAAAAVSEPKPSEPSPVSPGPRLSSVMMGCGSRKQSVGIALSSSSGSAFGPRQPRRKSASRTGRGRRRRPADTESLDDQRSRRRSRRRGNRRSSRRGLGDARRAQHQTPQQPYQYQPWLDPALQGHHQQHPQRQHQQHHHLHQHYQHHNQHQHHHHHHHQHHHHHHHHHHYQPQQQQYHYPYQQYGQHPHHSHHASPFPHHHQPQLHHQQHAAGVGLGSHGVRGAAAPSPYPSLAGPSQSPDVRVPVSGQGSPLSSPAGSSPCGIGAMLLQHHQQGAAAKRVRKGARNAAKSADSFWVEFVAEWEACSKAADDAAAKRTGTVLPPDSNWGETADIGDVGALPQPSRNRVGRPLLTTPAL